MHRNLWKLGSALIPAVIAASVGGWGTPAFAQLAFVERTGQRECFDAFGALTPCDGTGQDGEIQAGVEFPAARFRDNGDGTVTDRLTHLVWLLDADCLGSEFWEDALAVVAALNTGADFGCEDYSASTFADWRLPNIKELQSLIDFGHSDPALPADHPFVAVRPSAGYWSSTTAAVNRSNALVVLLSGGNTEGVDKDAQRRRVWAVRRGK
jgi:hypothetical protein